MVIFQRFQSSRVKTAVTFTTQSKLFGTVSTFVPSLSVLRSVKIRKKIAKPVCVFGVVRNSNCAGHKFSKQLEKLIYY